jgi:ABC-type nickel/cobalt efflux system permease component RcnA
LAVAVASLLCIHPAWAQAHNPFGVGISEGGGSASGITGWIIQEQVVFERQLSAAVRATKLDGSAFWMLGGLSFAYGIFHAAGPGHGKAVMTSYLFANERALKRGLVLTLLAAVLQGVVAIVLVGILALVLHATALRMKNAATLIESLSFASVAVLGAWLVWQKGWRFIQALRARPAAALPIRSPALACGHDHGLTYAFSGLAEPAVTHLHGPDCGHYHAPDPADLGQNFSWREALLTVVAAGSRPCSGAILVLVFSLAQGMFMAGIAATFAMSLGTAITTGALAALAVLAKGLALRMAAPTSRRGTLIIRGFEVAAAAVVLLAGLSLFLGYSGMGDA